MLKFRAVALLAGVSLLGACGETQAPMEKEKGVTWEEFQANAIQDPDNSQLHIVDGDIPVEGGEAGLREFFEAMVKESETAQNQDSLAVYRLNGVDIKWSATAARNITYCVSSASFGTRYSTVVNAMNSAAAAWEATSNVNFVHLSQYDSNCTASQTGVVFDVRQVSNAGYTARAFFPNSSRSSRNVLIDSSAFGNMGVWTLTGVLRHELGHTLGYRHEHTRLSSTGCYEDANWRALTSYDSASVMHYPQCRGTQTGDLVLTSLDKSGARALYP